MPKPKRSQINAGLEAWIRHVRFERGEDIMDDRRLRKLCRPMVVRILEAALAVKVKPDAKR